MGDTIRFHVTEEKVNDMTWEQYETLEAARTGGASLRDARRVFALFMVDEDGQPLFEVDAYARLRKAKVRDIAAISEQFWAAFRERAIPKENESSSSPESGTEEASPTGAES